MARGRRGVTAAEAMRVRGRIERWRQTRQKRSPMPEKLWAEAVALAHKHGVYRISQDLGVNYESLRSRVRQDSKLPPQRRSKAARAHTPARKEPAGFLELRATPAAIVAPPGADAAVVVEVQDASGAKLTVRLCADADVDVGALLDAFRGERRPAR